MGVYGKGSYLADSWNRLDMFIVLAGAVEYGLPNFNNINLSAVRTIRVLRPLRAINRIPSKWTFKLNFDCHIFPNFFKKLERIVSTNSLRQFVLCLESKRFKWVGSMGLLCLTKYIYTRIKCLKVAFYLKFELYFHYVSALLAELLRSDIAVVWITFSLHAAYFFSRSRL